MELMGKGSLQKYLISRGRSVVSQAELLSFARSASLNVSFGEYQVACHSVQLQLLFYTEYSEQYSEQYTE